MGTVPAKTGRQKQRKKNQAKRIKARLNAKNGHPQAHPAQSFYDLLSAAQTKALAPYIAEQVKTLGQAIAKNILQITAGFNLRLNVLETLVIKHQWASGQEELRDLYTSEEDTALGLTKSEEPAAAGDYVRFTALDTSNEKATLQYLSVEKLANKPYEANGVVEEAMIGMLTGDKKTVEAPMPDGRSYNFEITISRISKRLKAE